MLGHGRDVLVNDKLFDLDLLVTVFTNAYGWIWTIKQ